MVGGCTTGVGAAGVNLGVKAGAVAFKVGGLKLKAGAAGFSLGSGLVSAGCRAGDLLGETRGC